MDELLSVIVKTQSSWAFVHFITTGATTNFRNAFPLKNETKNTEGFWSLSSNSSQFGN